MSQKEIKVTFQPHSRDVYVLPGTKILEAAALAGIILDTPCGGIGKCGRCKVKIVSPNAQTDNLKLACQTAILEDTIVEVPQDSLLSAVDKIVTDSSILQSLVPDVRRCAADKCFGVAVDVGTTTLAASLVNIADGDEIAVTTAINPQISLGDNVISRIKYASSSNDATSRLQKIIIRQINEMIIKLCRQGGIEKENIYEIAVAGNTVMEHLVCGINPSLLGQLPFDTAWRGATTVNAGQLGLKINDKGIAYVFPIIGGFVGGDISAGMLALDLLNQPQPLLMVDIGTNGEILLVKNNKITAASTAAGPAFEGSGISCGMRAAAGAIEKVKFNDDCIYNVIDNTAPKGVCGSGLIDIMAELLNAGIVDSTGRIVQSAKVPPKIAQRIIIDSNGQPAFVIDKTIKITQKDVRQIQLAAGAMRAGINIMLKQAGINAGEIEKVFVAGGFGSFIRRNHAQRIGLLPKEIDHTKISFVGNTSLAGAKFALLSIKSREKAEELARQTKHIELSVDSDFQNEFASAMIFPAD